MVKTPVRSKLGPGLTTLLIILAAVLLVILWPMVNLLLLVFTSLLLAVFVRALSAFIGRLIRLPDAVAVIAVILLVNVLVGLLGWFFAPQLVAQAEKLTAKIPQAVMELQQGLEQNPFGRALLDQLPLANEPVNFLRGIFSTFSATLAALTHTVFVLFAAFYLAINPSLYHRIVLMLIPLDKHKRAEEVLTEVIATIRAWLVGRFISMMIVGVLVTLGLWLLDMPLALILGILAGLLDFVPVIGPLVAALPALLLASEQGLLQVLYVAALYFLVQQLESGLITPLVQQEAVALPPALTLTVMLLMGGLFGILGVLVAAPLTAVMLVLVKMLYVQDVLGNTSATLVRRSMPGTSLQRLRSHLPRLRRKSAPS